MQRRRRYAKGLDAVNDDLKLPYLRLTTGAGRIANISTILKAQKTYCLAESSVALPEATTISAVFLVKPQFT